MIRLASNTRCFSVTTLARRNNVSRVSLQVWRRPWHPWPFSSLVNCVYNNGFARTNARSYSNNRSNRGNRHKRPKYEFWNVKESQSVQQLLQTTIDNIDITSPPTMAAVWNHLSFLLKRSKVTARHQNEIYFNERQQEEREELEHQIAFVLQRTIHSLNFFKPKHLTTTILSIAKLVQQTNNQHSNNIETFAFRNILLDNQGNLDILTFHPFTEAAYYNLQQFNTQSLSNLAYAHALLRFNPQLQHVTLMESIANKALAKIQEFEPQGISNTLWSFATLKVIHPALFQGMGDFMTKHGLEGFKPQELSNVVWSFATLDISHATLLEKIGDAIVTLDLNAFKPQEISNTVWAYATLSSPHNHMFHSIATHVATLNNLDAFKPQALAIIVWSYAKCNIHHLALLNKVTEAILKRGGMAPQNLANVVWAYATLNESNQELFGKVGYDVINRGLSTFKPQEISNIMWAFATANIKHQPLFDKVGNHIASDDLKGFKSQELSNIVWAFATSAVQHHNLFHQIADRIVTDLESFNAQELSNTLWAYATANVQESELFAKVGHHVIKTNKLQSFKSQELSNTVWAYAKANTPNSALFTKIGDHIAELDVTTFKTQEISNILWAYAILNERHAGLFETMANTIVEQHDLNVFSPQNISNIIWSFATVGIRHNSLFDKVGDTITELDNLDSFSPQSLSNIVWAYATANIHHISLFDKVGDAIIHLDLEAFTPQELSMVVWSYATVNELRDDVFEKVVEAIVNLELLPLQCIPNLAWSFAVLDVDNPSLFNDVFVNAIVRKQDGFTDEALRQLYQWHLWRTHENSALGLPNDLCDKCKDAFISCELTKSTFQKNVLEELDSIGLNPEEEYLTGSGYRLDALVVIDGKKVGIEIDGPSHFIGQRANGGTTLKRRQVTAIDGIPVVSVPFWEWERFGYDQDQKHGYLRLLLNCGVK